MAARPGINIDEFHDDEEEIRPTERDQEKPSQDDDDDDDDASPVPTPPDHDDNADDTGEHDAPTSPADAGSAPDNADDRPESSQPPVGEGEEPAPVTESRSVQRVDWHGRRRDKLLLLKASGALGIQADPFHSEVLLDEEAFPAGATVLRWRAKSDEVELSSKTPLTELESNGRIVEWEDGSRTLHIGSEAFEFIEEKLSSDNPLQLYQSQAGVQAWDGLLCAKVNLRPFNKKKRIGVATERAVSKNRRVVASNALSNPEQAEREALRSAAEKERLRNRQEASRRRQEMRRLEAAGGRKPGAVSRYLEDDDEELEDESDDEADLVTPSRENDFEDLARRRRERENPDRLMKIKQGGADDRPAEVKSTRETPTKHRRRVLSDSEEDDADAGDSE